MTKLKIGVVSAIAVAGVAIPMALQQQSKAKLRKENNSLWLRLGQLEQENLRLSNFNVQAKGGQPLSNDQYRELMRLRGEIGSVRNQKNELERLRGESRRLRPPQANAPAIPIEPSVEPPDDILPLVQFQEAPLVDVVKTLARQANLNITFDPRVTAVDPTTGESVHPPVSLRLENVTAENVLEAVLNNNNLQLVRDPKTRIDRVTIKDPAAQTAE